MSFFDNVTISNNFDYPMENEGVEQYALSPDGHQRAFDQCQPLTVNNFNQVRHDLDQRLHDRPPRNNLVEHGIIPPRGTSGSVFIAARKLQLIKTKDTLNRRISNRPQKKDLIQRNILECGKVDPTLQANSKKLKRLQIVNELKSFIRNRPTPDKLVEDNILEPEFLNNLHINSSSNVQSNEAQNIGIDEKYASSNSFRSLPFTEFPNIDQYSVSDHSRLISNTNITCTESELPKNSAVPLHTRTVSSENSCMEPSAISSLRNQISTISVGNIPSNPQYIDIGEPLSQQSFSTTHVDSNYSVADQRHLNNVILSQQERIFPKNDIPHNRGAPNGSYYIANSASNKQMTHLSNRSSDRNNVCDIAHNDFHDISDYPLYLNNTLSSRSHTLVSRASLSDLPIQKVSNAQENNQTNQSSRVRGKKGQKKNPKELKYHFAQGTLVKDHQAKIIFTNEKSKLRKAQSCSSIKTRPSDDALQSTTVLSPKWHNNVTQRITELKTSVGVPGKASEFHEMVDGSANAIAQSLPLSRSKMPGLFFSGNLTEDFENQEQNFTYDEGIPESTISVQEPHSGQDSIQFVCNEKTNATTSPSLPVDDIYGNSDVIHKHANTQSSILHESIRLPRDGNDNLESDKQLPFNQTELDLETVTDGISYDFEKEPYRDDLHQLMHELS